MVAVSAVGSDGSFAGMAIPSALLGTRHHIVESMTKNRGLLLPIRSYAF